MPLYLSPVPVVSLVGYTNAGKSTLLNQLTGADFLLKIGYSDTGSSYKRGSDQSNKSGKMKNGNALLLTDTVGFIQKLPNTLVAAFRATLEIPEPLLLVDVVGIRIEEVDNFLSEMDVASIPRLMVCNKVDRVSDVKKLKLKQRENKMLSRICFE